MASASHSILFSARVVGTLDDDMLVGTEQGEQLGAKEGNDQIFARAGDDTVFAGPGNDKVYASLGDDTIFAGPGNDQIFAGTGDDLQYGGEGSDTLYSGEGSDTFYAGAGKDLIGAGAGDDTLYGGGGDDTLFGAAGNDVVSGGLGDDAIYGGAGDDTLTAGIGDDTVFAGDGKDVVVLAGASTAYTISGNGGTLTAAGSGGTITLNGVELIQFDDKTVAVEEPDENNTPPAGSADSYEMDEDTTLTVNEAAGVLSNDADTDEDTLEAVLTAGPSHGTLTLNADGSFVYTPAANFSGTDTFTYAPNDGKDAGNPVTVTVSVANTFSIRPIIPPPNQDSFLPVMSDDGSTIALSSMASNLHPSGDPNGHLHDIFVYDVVERELINFTLGADGASYAPNLSGDGSKVVFHSDATNLDGVDLNGSKSDVFLGNLATGEVANITNGANGPSDDAIISADGSTVVYYSLATDISPDSDLNGQEDLFLYDTEATATLRITDDADGRIFYTGMSDDASVIIFTSEATNLTAGVDINGSIFDVFLYERDTDTLTNITNGGNSDSVAESRPSSDGTVIAFQSTATNLTAAVDTNGSIGDCFIYNHLTGTTVNITNGGNAYSFSPVVSADGSTVVFSSEANNLAPGIDANGSGSDVYVYDVATGGLTKITSGGNGSSQATDISADGSKVIFTSLASNLVEGDTNGQSDVFLYDATTDEIIMISELFASGGGDLSRDGLFATFETNTFGNEGESPDYYWSAYLYEA